jgi:protein SCO1/2
MRILLALALVMWPAFAAAEEDVTIEEHLGAQLPLELAFRDQDGRTVLLGSELQQGVPTILVLAYYECPMLCGLTLKGLVGSVKNLDWKLGERYRVLTVSFDPKDGPHNADLKQRSVLEELGFEQAKPSWPFLVGKENEIRALSDALGFRYTYDASAKQFAHPAAVFVLTPEGRVSRYLYGVEYPVRDLKLSLMEASAGRSSSSLERFILTCFKYNPATRRYGLYVFGFLRTGAALVAIALGLSIYRLRKREQSS